MLVLILKTYYYLYYKFVWYFFIKIKGELSRRNNIKNFQQFEVLI